MYVFTADVAISISIAISIAISISLPRGAVSLRVFAQSRKTTMYHPGKTAFVR